MTIRDNILATLSTHNVMSIVELCTTIQGNDKTIRCTIEYLCHQGILERVSYKPVKVQLCQNKNIDLEKENQRLHKQLDLLTKHGKITSYNFQGKTLRFGALGDTQLCSRYEKLDLLEAAYDFFEAEGISLVLHAGDFLDGEKVYRGHEYELHTIGADAQIRYAVQNYPKKAGITTEFITGNHDACYWKQMGLDVGESLAEQRDDLIYLGMQEADKIFTSDEGRITVRLTHPSGGTAYAVSYKSQKYIESLSGGQKPNLIFMGHFHKQEHIFFRNVHCIQVGCIQEQTPFMRGIPTPAIMGFYLVELVVRDESILRCKPEFIPAYY